MWGNPRPFPVAETSAYRSLFWLSGSICCRAVEWRFSELCRFACDLPCDLDTTRRQLLALGRLGWTLTRIQHTTGVRRVTISRYLKAAGIVVCGRGPPSESRGPSRLQSRGGTAPERRASESGAALLCPRHYSWQRRSQKSPRCGQRLWGDSDIDLEKFEPVAYEVQFEEITVTGDYAFAWGGS